MSSAAAYQLTPGCIEQMMRAEPSVPLAPNSVLQVLGTKPVAANNTNSSAGGQPDERWRLAASDGKHQVNCLASTSLSPLIRNGDIQKFTVIRVDNSIGSIVHGRKIPIIVACTVLGTPAEKIGEPVAWVDQMQQQQPPQPQQQQQHQASGYDAHNQWPAPINQQQPPAASTYQSPYAPPVQPSAAATTSYGASAGASHYGASSSTAAYGATSSGYQAQGQPRQASSYAGGISGGQDQITPIAALSPYGNAWTICGRVTSKGDMRTFNNKRNNSEGKLFSFTLLDESMDVRVTCFGSEVDRFYPLIHQGRVYKMTNGQIKPANTRFSNTQCQYEITANHDTTIDEVTDTAASSIPTIKMSVVPLAELISIPKDGVCDVIGIIEDPGHVANITSKATNRELTKRDVTLVDQSGYSVRLTLWGNQAQEFEGQAGEALAVKAAKVGDFGGRSLSYSSGSSTLMINPDIPEAHSLHGWYASPNRPATWHTHSGASMATAGGGAAGGDLMASRNEVVPLIEMADDSVGRGKGDWYTCEVYVTHIRNNTIAYPGCPKCSKKVNVGAGGWHCEKCQATYPMPEYRYVMSLCGADASGQMWFQAFNDIGKVILSMEANELMQLREHDPLAAQAVMDDALFKPFRFRVRAKEEMFQGEARPRHSIMEVTPLDNVQSIITSAQWALGLIRDYDGQQV